MRHIKQIGMFFLKKDGGKEVINRTKLFSTVFVVIVLGAIPLIHARTGGDNSVIINATEPIDIGNFETAQASSPTSQKVSDLLKASEQRVLAPKPRKAKPVSQNKQQLKYKAPQVIERKDSFTSKMPIGSNLIGKLLTAIDTRESEQLYKVLLPYGGKGRHGEGIPKNSILFGTITYPNKGRKVFMQFSKALLPDGREVELKAQALNAKDYSPGLEGKSHLKQQLKTHSIKASLKQVRWRHSGKRLNSATCKHMSRFPRGKS